MLVTVDGAIVAYDEFTVQVSDADPNALKGIGPRIAFRKLQEDYGQSLVRRIVERKAAERARK